MPTPVQPTPLKDGSTANTSGGSLSNKDFFEFGMAVHSLNSADMPPIKLRRVPRAGAHGGFFFQEHYDSKPLTMTGQITGDTHADLKTNIEAAKQFLNTFRQVSPRRLKLIDPEWTDRFFYCYYDGEAIFGSPRPRTLGTIAPYAVRLVANPPFALSTTLSTETYAATAGTFKQITTGSMDSDLRMVIEGAATNPKMVFGDSIFIAPFNLTTSFTDILGDTVTGTFSGTAAQEAGLFSPSDLGLGHAFLANGAYTMTWTVTGSKDFGSWFTIVEPQFDATATGSKVIFEHRFDVNNRVRLLYENSGFSAIWNRRFLFIKDVTTGEDAYLRSGVQSFVAGDAIKIGCSYDSTNGMKLYINGTLVDSNGVTSSMSNNPTTLTLHANGANFSANMVHYLAAWSSQLSDNEQKLISDDPEENIVNRNEVLLYTGTLAAGDWLEFDRMDDNYKGQLMDVSAGTLTTGKFPDDGFVIPKLARDTTSIYHVTSAANFYLQWRNAYI